MDFIDLKAQQKSIKDKIDKRIQSVLNHGKYIMGPEVYELEERLADYVGSKYCISCSSGTDALLIPLIAKGIGPGDAVFVPSFTYIATAESPSQLGATPFFVDVKKDTFNLDVESFKQAIVDCKKLNLRPSVVIPVDLFGQPADIDNIKEVAEENNIKVLIDGAQSFGAITKNRRVGSMGDATTTSFFPAKPLGCYGDGGAIFTNNDNDAEIINSIRLHGKGSHKYENIRIGLNSRIDTIQAAILIEKLKIFQNELISREKVANLYSKNLPENIISPTVSKEIKSAWAQYTITIHERDIIQTKLKENGIPSIIYYPIPLSRQAGYEKYPEVSSVKPAAIGPLLPFSVQTLWLIENILS